MEEVEGEMRSLGFAYVQFETEEEANNFKQEFSGKKLNGMEVEVENFVPFKDRIQNIKVSNIYLKNFNDDMKKEDIETFIDKEFK